MHWMQEGIDNMSKTKIFGIALGVVALVAAMQPAQAACGSAFLITSLGATEYAYLYNPSVTDDGLNGSTITDQLTGFFWGVGVGDPTLGVGADNGTWSALDWLGPLSPGYGAYINTTWAASTGIDTCIDVQGPIDQRCQVTFFQDVDVNTGAGLFALMSTPSDPTSGDFLLTNGGNPINMAPQEGMAILSSSRANFESVDLMLSGPTAEGLAAGSYLSDAAACQGTGAGGVANGLIVGYRVVTQVLPRGSAPPSDFHAAMWSPASQDTAIGSPAAANVPCASGDSDVYTSFQLLFDSGFASPIVSNTTTRIECGPNVAEPGQGIRVKPEGRQQAPRTRSR